ncbi:MAG: primosomal protein N', partial [Pseudomonadota bacterium]
MQALTRSSYRQIAESLIEERKALGFPPFSRVVMFRADATELKAALSQLELIRGCIESSDRIDEIHCIGPIPALMTRRIGRYRAQLCLMSRDYQALRSVLYQSMPQIQQLPAKSGVNWNVDVDAYDL